MAVSASTLFHFTDDLDKLYGILQRNFIPRYCLEDYQSLFSKRKHRVANYAVPMACFCDIPLSQIREHVKYYGRYAIGLSKEWATKRRLNPVIYVNPGSHLSDYVMNLLTSAAEDLSEGDISDVNRLSSAAELLGYSKPYRGYVTKLGMPKKRKVFYNEREWRFVPFVVEAPEVPWRLSQDEYADEQTRIRANMQLEASVRLKFEPKDIKYVVISKEEEILDLVREIEDAKEGKYSRDDIRVLTTKIITIEKILEDM